MAKNNVFTLVNYLYKNNNLVTVSLQYFTKATIKSEKLSMNAMATVKKTKKKKI